MNVILYVDMSLRIHMTASYSFDLLTLSRRKSWSLSPISFFPLVTTIHLWFFQEGKLTVARNVPSESENGEVVFKCSRRSKGRKPKKKMVELASYVFIWFKGIWAKQKVLKLPYPHIQTVYFSDIVHILWEDKEQAEQCENSKHAS